MTRLDKKIEDCRAGKKYIYLNDSTLLQLIPDDLTVVNTINGYGKSVKMLSKKKYIWGMECSNY